MNPIRLSLAILSLGVLAVAATTGTGVATAAPSWQRNGCAIVTDATGDTAADVGAPATVPQADPSLDITSVDVASNARWIGARVRVVKLDQPAMQTGGEAFEVSMKVAGGTLVMGAGRYGNATGIDGDSKWGYAGFSRGTLAPRDVPARAVQLAVDTTHQMVSVYVDRAALSDIGAELYGYASGISASSGRQFADELTVQYDTATGSHAYPLNGASCLRLP